jgi:serine protease Do
MEDGHVRNWFVACVMIGAVACAKPEVKAASVVAPAAPKITVKTPAEIAASAMPSVVSVRTDDKLGTGFIVSSRGLIATSLHVIEGATRISVELSDHRKFNVIDVSRDARADLAVLRIDANRLPSLALGDSSAMRAGDAVVAIGNPLGLEDTVSNGLISAVRKLPSGFTYLQMSAPIAQGSSGGPIFNDHGDVIGVCAAVMKSGQNLNFGIPTRYLKILLDDPDPITVDALAAESRAAVANAAHPAPARQIPHHPTSLIATCDAPSLQLIGETIASAIEVGAPLYNSGNHAACYHIYEGAAADLEHKLPHACQGAIDALAKGRERAASLTNATEQAWAMRDAFDGLIEVIVRARKKN